MKKKIEFFKMIIPAVIGLGMIFSSCFKEYDDCCSTGDYIVSFGIVEQKSTTDNDYVIHLDEGDIVVPLASSSPWIDVKNNQRVLVNFEPMRDEKLTDSTQTYYARIYSLRSILFKGIKKYTEVADDSMGHDPIVIRDAWISKTGGILNIDMRYFTQGSVHYINLIDNGEANGIIKPFVLELRHNARGDRNAHPAAAFVSFKLDYLKISGKNETKFIVRYTDYDGKNIEIPFTYKY